MPDSRPRLSSAIGPWLWMVCIQYFIVEQVARLAWSLPYSMASNVISDLGAVQCGDGRLLEDGSVAINRAAQICSPLHALMNGSFVLQGCLIVGGSMLVRRLFPEGRRYTVALALVALSGFGVFAVGLAPEDVNLRVHSLGAALHFFGGNVGMLLTGFALRRQQSALPNRLGQAAPATLAAGAIGLAATLLLVAGHDLGLGIGGIERVAAYPLTIWLTGMGVLLHSQGTHPVDPSRVRLK